MKLNHTSTGTYWDAESGDRRQYGQVIRTLVVRLLPWDRTRRIYIVDKSTSRIKGALRENMCLRLEESLHKRILSLLLDKNIVGSNADLPNDEIKSVSLGICRCSAHRTGQHWHISPTAYASLPFFEISSIIDDHRRFSAQLDWKYVVRIFACDRYAITIELTSRVIGVRCFAAAAATTLPRVPPPIYMTAIVIHNESPSINTLFITLTVIPLEFQ